MEGLEKVEAGHLVIQLNVEKGLFVLKGRGEWGCLQEKKKVVEYTEIPQCN